MRAPVRHRAGARARLASAAGARSGSSC